MKKKILLILIVLISLLTITGCGSEKMKKENGPEIIAKDITIYVGVDFDANQYAMVDDDVNLEVIRNDVNDKTPGEYTVTYKATDNSGKSSTKTIMVTVDELNQDKLKQELDNIVSNLGLTDYTLKSNAGHGYNIFSNNYLNNKINDYQTMKMYNGISVIDDILASSASDIKLNKDHYVYYIPKFSFYFEFTDRNEKLNERYSLRSINKSMQISNDEQTITIQNDTSAGMGRGKADSQYEDSYYNTHFYYDMKTAEIETLKEILSSSNIKVIVNTYYNERDIYQPMNEKEVPKTFEFNLSEEDISSLKTAVKLYDNIIKIIG